MPPSSPYTRGLPLKIKLGAPLEGADEAVEVAEDVVSLPEDVEQVSHNAEEGEDEGEERGCCEHADAGGVDPGNDQEWNVLHREERQSTKCRVQSAEYKVQLQAPSYPH